MKVIIEIALLNCSEIYYDDEYDLKFESFGGFLYCYIYEKNAKTAFSYGRVIAYVPKKISSNLFLT